MLIDTHCHLDAKEFAADRDEVVCAARQVGVARIIIPAVALTNFQAVRDCCQRYPGCQPAYGIHPLYVDQNSASGEEELGRLHSWLVQEARGEYVPFAVGEIGLDYFVPKQDAARQNHFYIEQLKIARELGLPVLLHVRRAVDEVLKGLRRVGVRAGIAHAFNGSHQQAEAFMGMGFKLGFGGAMTYPGSTRIRELAATLPLEAIVLETDAPDMAPVWLAGQKNRRNAPEELLRIAACLADLRGISLDVVLNRTAANVAEIAPC